MPRAGCWCPRCAYQRRELRAGQRLDGLLLDVTDCTEAELADGAALITEIGAFGAGGRALYGPRAADPRCPVSLKVERSHSSLSDGWRPC
ncbi:hypothetical protein [Streptomyces qinglanensis]|uniref:hypothetical protein n=1 Tax=Streptomyces qinglanensis TaxID=943816 RepID=UPI003D7486F7